MIKTIIVGDALARALDRQQRWVDAHVDPDVAWLEAHHQARAHETEILQAQNADLKLRMAKARLRSRTR